MPNESFLFVPYLSGRKNSSSSDVTDSDARSHAAAVSRRRRDLKVRSSGQSKVSFGPSQLSLNVPPVPQPQHSREWSLHNETTTEPTSLDDDVRAQKRQHMRAMQFSWRAGTLTNDIGLSDGWRTDPFGPNLGDQFANSVIDYYAQVITPLTNPAYTIFNVTNVYTAYFFELLQNDDFHHAGLAMAGAVMQSSSKPGKPPSNKVRQNQAKAVSRLRQKCLNTTSQGSSPNDDMTIVTVLALASLSRFCGDTSSYQAHRGNLASMINRRGGIDELDHNHQIRCIVQQWDSFFVFATDGCSLFPDSRPSYQPVYPIFPLSSDLHSHFERLPIGFQTLVLQGKLSAEIVEILGRTSEAEYNGIKTLSPSNIYQSRPNRHHDFVEACPCLGARDSSTPNLEKQLCLAILLYCTNSYTDTRSSTSLYGAVRGELTRVLQRKHDPWKTDAERECAFWIIAVCIDSWRECDRSLNLLPNGHDLLPVLNEMCVELAGGGGGSDYARAVLGKFFCNEDFSIASQRHLKAAERA